MDYDEGKTARFIRTGGFAVNLLVQATQYCSLLMCVCVLGELQWPLTRDAPVIRLALRTFVFAISGLLYGLQFPPTCSTDVLDTLERVFLKFGHFEDLSESGEGKKLITIFFSFLPYWLSLSFSLFPLIVHFLLHRETLKGNNIST